VLFFWVVFVALFALIDIFLLSYNVIKINQDKTSTMRCKSTADLEIKGSDGENQNVKICAAAKCKSIKTNCKMISTTNEET
jgi:hypothetical protein